MAPCPCHSCGGDSERDLSHEEVTKSRRKAGSQISSLHFVGFVSEQWFSVRDDLAPQGSVGKVWRHV